MYEAFAINLIIQKGDAFLNNYLLNIDFFLNLVPLVYSPNLNPIERLWKVMNEFFRNNRFFKTAQEFRKAILEFFETTWPQISLKMIDRIYDSFQIIKSPV